MMTRCSSIAIVCLALATAACWNTKREARYCDEASPCIDSSLPYCDVSSRACVAAPLDGGLDGQMHDQAEACGSSATCTTEGAPVCGDDGMCRACIGSADDSTCATKSPTKPRCAQQGDKQGQCVACAPSAASATSVDCVAENAPVCGRDGVCRGCAAHVECPSKLCVFDGPLAGSCAAITEVALADNNGMPIATCKTTRPTRDGASPSTAYCDVVEAVADAKQFVIVKGSAVPYSAIALTDQSLTLVGPGKAAATTARLFTAGVDSVGMTVNTNAHRVVVDGLDLGGDSGSKALRGVNCTNNTALASNATLVVRDSIIHDTNTGSGGAGVSTSGGTVTLTGLTISGSGGAGVSTSGGTVTLRGSTVRVNTGGGLRISDGSYVVENNLIAANGLAGPGVYFSGNVSGTFWFNTVVGNKVSAGVGGINCAGVLNGQPLIQASIVWGNDASSNASTISCSLTYSDLSDMPVPAGLGNFSADPLFVDTTDYRLQSGSPCADRVTVASGLTGGTLPSFDRKGTSRPAHSGFDIGADEVE